MPRVEPVSNSKAVTVLSTRNGKAGRNSLTAAATLLSGATSSNPKKRKKIKRQSWQLRAWEWYDEIGEYRFAVVWVGNMLSKATLHVVDEKGDRVEDEKITAVMAELFGGAEAQGEMLRQLGIHFTVAGEGYLVGEDKGDDESKWMVAAATEVSTTSDGYKVGNREVSKANNIVVRMYRPHPRNADDSDAPSRAVLPILAEIDGLTKHVAAQIDSRLAGAGMLLVPNEISSTVVTTAGTDENGEEVSGSTQASSVQQLINDLMTAMMTAIGNREDASALVPIILQGPGEHLDAIRHLVFSTDLDKMAIDLRAEAIRRLALGMDMPPEVLTGTADMNHWGSWQVEEASIKAHTEPLLRTITDGLTTGYLRPVLEADGVENPGNYTVVADTSAMRLRPNRSAEAFEAYDRGALGVAALLRENGFEEGDEMDEKELAQWLTKKIAGGSTTPEMVEAAARILGVMLPAVTIAEPEAPAETGTEERPTPSLEDHPRRELPERDDSANAAAVAAAEMVVFRALERAGNRLKNRRSVTASGHEAIAAADLYMYVPALAPEEIGDLLTDAWSCLDRFDYPISRHSIDTYTRMLLMDQRKHDRGMMSDYLNASLIIEGVRG